MSVKEVVMDDNHKDDHVEDEIQACFDRKSPKSFLHMRELVRVKRTAL